ncbi:MAG: PIG-L family deacetylase [Clostridia bacterium]|nr:PIG-L family deacetylase [Clostridia bacterium]
MLLLSAHPDDELLWFGGTLPTYAGERGKQVQLVYLAHGDARRKNELLDGLWTCGVHAYPVIG